MFENPPGGWRCFLPDGYAITVCGSSNGSPPDRQRGMSTNSSTAWVRLVGPRFDSGWHCCSHPSAFKARMWWELVATRADFAEAWMLSTGEAMA